METRPADSANQLYCSFFPSTGLYHNSSPKVCDAFSSWAHTCTCAKPQLTPRSYCRQRKQSILLLSLCMVCLRLPHSLPPNGSLLLIMCDHPQACQLHLRLKGLLFFCKNGMDSRGITVCCSLSNPSLIASVSRAQIFLLVKHRIFLSLFFP